VRFDWRQRPQFHSRGGIHGTGVGDADPLDLNKRGNLNLNFRGAGDATGVGVGVGDASAVVLRRTRLGVAEAVAGDSAAERGAVLSIGGVASVFS
jgi:hypothetical protein